MLLWDADLKKKQIEAKTNDLVLIAASLKTHLILLISKNAT